MKFSKDVFCILLVNLAVVCFGLFLADSFGVMDVGFLVNTEILLGLGLGFLFWFLVSPLDSKHQTGQVSLDKCQTGYGFRDFLFNVSPYLFLSLLMVIALNRFLEIDFVEVRMLRFSFFAIFFGAVTFWNNRDRVEGEIEEEKRKEGEAERRREEEFDRKFPFLKKFDFKYTARSKGYGVGGRVLRVLGAPFVRVGRLPYGFVRWMYREGWWYSGALIGIVVLGFVLRILGIEKTKLLADEGYVAIGINGILNTGLPYLNSWVVYPRGIGFMYLSSIFVKIFGYNEFGLRFFSLLSGVLMIFLIYSIFKILTSSKLYSLVVSLIFSIYPLFIEYSRFSRWYLPLSTIYLSIYYFYLLYRKSNKIIFMYMIVFLSVLSPFIGEHGYFVIIFSGILFLDIFLKKPLFRLTKEKVLFFVFCFLIIGSTFTAFYLEKNSYYNGVKNSNEDDSRNELLNVPSFGLNNISSNFKSLQERFSEVFVFPFIFILIALLFLLINKVEIKFTCSTILLSLSLILVLPRILTRLYFFLIPFFLICLFLSLFLSMKKYKITSLILILVLLCLMWNSFLYYEEDFDHNFGPIENTIFLPAPLLDYNPDLENACNYIKENFNEDDILISSLKGNLFFYCQNLDFWIKKDSIDETATPLSIYMNKSNLFWDKNDGFSKKIDKFKDINFTQEIYIDMPTGAVTIYNELDFINMMEYQNSRGRIFVISSKFDKNQKTVGSYYVQLLEKNIDKIKYFGEDNITKVYVFDKNCSFA